MLLHKARKITKMQAKRGNVTQKRKKNVNRKKKEKKKTDTLFI